MGEERKECVHAAADKRRGRAKRRQGIERALGQKNGIVHRNPQVIKERPQSPQQYRNKEARRKDLHGSLCHTGVYATEISQAFTAETAGNWWYHPLPSWRSPPQKSGCNSR